MGDLKPLIFMVSFYTNLFCSSTIRGLCKAASLIELGVPRILAALQQSEPWQPVAEGQSYNAQVWGTS